MTTELHDLSPDSKSHFPNRPNGPRLRAYLLAELRCAALRARLAANDIDAIGIALNGDLITAIEAIELLDDTDAIRFLVPTPETASPIDAALDKILTKEGT
jgi:hypothetical protein